MLGKIDGKKFPKQPYHLWRPKITMQPKQIAHLMLAWSGLTPSAAESFLRDAAVDKTRH